MEDRGKYEKSEMIDRKNLNSIKKTNNFDSSAHPSTHTHLVLRHDISVDAGESHAVDVTAVT